MKLRIIILFVCINLSLVNAQTYEKDWIVLDKKLDDLPTLKLVELESFAVKYEKKLDAYPDNTMKLYSMFAYKYWGKGEFDNAEKSFKYSYGYALKATDTSLKYTAIYRLGEFYKGRGNFVEAEKYYYACLRPLSVILGQSSREYTQIFSEYTEVTIGMGKYAYARPSVEGLLYYYKTLDGENSLHYLEWLNYMAIVHKGLGEYKEAIEIFTSLVEGNRFLALGDTSMHITSYNNLGDVYRAVGRYEPALLNLKKAKQEFYRLKIKDKDHLTTIENNLALCHKVIGNRREAEDCFENCIKLYKELGKTKSEGYCTALSNYGDLLRELGRFDDALDVLLESIETRKIYYGTNSENYANTCSNIALVLFDLGYYKESLERNLQANEIYASVVGEGHQSYGNSFNNLSICYMMLKDYKNAERCKLRALEILEKAVGKDHFRYHACLVSTFGLYTRTNQPAKAESYLKEALILIQKNFGKKHESYANAQFSLAYVYFLQRKYDLAAPLFTESIDFYSTLLGGHFDAMSEGNQGRYYQLIGPMFESYNSFLLSYKIAQPTKNLDPLIARALKNQLLLKSLLTSKAANVRKQIFNSGDENLIKLYEDWLKSQNEIINSIKSAEPLENTELYNKVSTLGTAISSKVSSFSKTETIDYEKIKQSLKDNEAAIELFKTEEWLNDSNCVIRYGAIVVKKSAVQPELIIYNKANELDSSGFVNYSNCIDEQLTDTSSYRIYFKKMEPCLKGITKIYVAADGVFQKINLAGLYNTSTKKFVQENYEISQVFNISSLANKQPLGNPADLTASLFGYPDYDYDFKKQSSLNTKPEGDIIAKRYALTNLSKLPGTKKEVEDISKMLKASNWKVNVYTDQFASEENLRKLNSVRILHIATHGFYLKDIESKDKLFLGFENSSIKAFSDLRSGIILAGASPATADTLNKNSENDGIVTSAEAELLNLNNTELVVLSACQTGLGDDRGSQGVAGLQRSFAVAGARNVIMSLWPVDDNSTQYLMTEFYKNYSLTQNVESSFRLAQAATKQKYPHPYYWAAFVLLKTFN